MGNREWGMGNGEWGIGNANETLPTYPSVTARKPVKKPGFYNQKTGFLRYVIITLEKIETYADIDGL